MHFILFYAEISRTDNTLLYWIPIRRIEFTDRGVKKKASQRNIATCMYFQNKFRLKLFLNRVQRTEKYALTLPLEYAFFMREHTITDLDSTGYWFDRRTLKDRMHKNYGILFVVVVRLQLKLSFCHNLRVFE